MKKKLLVLTALFILIQCYIKHLPAKFDVLCTKTHPWQKRMVQCFGMVLLNVKMYKLFLSKCNFHRMRWRYLESLQRFLGGTALQFRWKFNKRNVVTVRHQTNLFEAGELIEQLEYGNDKRVNDKSVKMLSVWHTIDNIISFVSSGRFVKNKIWFGGCSAVFVFALPESAFAAFFFFFSLKFPKKKNSLIITVRQSR